MINHHAFGYEEIIQIMDTLVALICEIQSEIRKKEYHDWYQQKIRNYSYHHENDENDKEILLNKIVLFLPLYFEMAMTRIDELQLEVCVSFFFF